MRFRQVESFLQDLNKDGAVPADGYGFFLKAPWEIRGNR